MASQKREWAESFLLYKAQDPKRTDGVARAMADLDVNLTLAEVDWEIAKRKLDTQAQEFEIRRLQLLIGAADAEQERAAPRRAEDGWPEPNARAYQDRKNPASSSPL